MSRSRSPSPRNTDDEARRSRSRDGGRSASRSRSRSRSERRHVDRRSDDRTGTDNRYDRRDDSRDEKTSSTSVLVRKLSYRTSIEELKRPFLEFGEVTDVYIPLDYHSRRPRGFGFVKFAREEDANAAIRAMDGTEIDGAKVEVVLAQQSRKSPRTMRKTTRNSDRYSRRSYRDYDDSRRGGYGYRESRRRSRSRSRSRSYSRGRGDRSERRERGY
jgi:RNA recognition motif-containing protein